MNPPSRHVPTITDSPDRRESKNRLACKTRNTVSPAMPVFDDAALAVLEDTFQVDRFPSAEVRAEMGERLGASARQIQVWFQNRRARERKKETVEAGESAPGEMQDLTSPVTAPAQRKPRGQRRRFDNSLQNDQGIFASPTQADTVSRGQSEETRAQAVTAMPAGRKLSQSVESKFRSKSLVRVVCVYDLVCACVDGRSQRGGLARSTGRWCGGGWRGALGGDAGGAVEGRLGWRAESAGAPRGWSARAIHSECR